jgi:hypothetical protein
MLRSEKVFSRGRLALSSSSLALCCRKAGPLLLLGGTTDYGLISGCRKADPLLLLSVMVIYEKLFFCAVPKEAFF